MSYSERYTRRNARKKVGDSFNLKKKETFLSIRVTFTHFWETRRRLLNNNFVFTLQPWFCELGFIKIAPTKNKAEKKEIISPRNPYWKWVFIFHYDAKCEIPFSYMYIILPAIYYVEDYWFILLTILYIVCVIAIVLINLSSWFLF